MKAVRVRFPLLLAFLAFLALLPASVSSPAAADWGSIAAIALRGQTVTAPPAPTIKLADFGPPDVNDVLQVTFVAMNDVGGGHAGPPCVLYRRTGGTLQAMAYDGQTTPLGTPLQLCPFIFERPPMVDGAGGVVFQGLVPPGKAIFYVAPSGSSVTPIVYQGETPTPVGGSFGLPTLLDFTSQCDNAVDDDGDGSVNDGCPALGVREPVGQCADSIDNDGDGRVNDGCDPVGPAEKALQVLFQAPVVGAGTPPEGIFLATGAGTFTKVVAPGDTVIGGTIGTLGDASMNNSGQVAYEANISGVAPYKEAIFLTGGGGGGGGGAHTKVVGADAPETGTQCTDSSDSDGDGHVNEGCPADQGAETGGQCTNSSDDDGDGRVNDGCPPDGGPESGLQCDNATDDDGDGDVNDGCPAHGQEESGDDCSNDDDDDDDSLVNDGCPTHGDTWNGDPAYDNTLRAVGEPRISDAGTVVFKAEASDDYGEGYFVSEPQQAQAAAASEPQQAEAAAMEQSPSVLGASFSCGLGPLGRHGVTGDGDLVMPGCGGDPLEGVITFPWYRKVAVAGELAPGYASATYQTFSDSSTSDDDSSDEAVAVAYKASTSSDNCNPSLSHACGGVFGGTIEIKDSDEDGIPDDQETAGVNEDNQGGVDLNLPAMGADPNRKDLFVEVDYMDCTVGTWADNDGDTIPDDGLPADCAVGDTHNHKPRGGIIEDGVLGQTCDDGVDNGGVDGLVDTNDPDCSVVKAFAQAPVYNPTDNESGAAAGTCSDGNDNDGDNLKDNHDPDCLGISLHVYVDEAIAHADFLDFPKPQNKGASACYPGGGGVNGVVDFNAVKNIHFGFGPPLNERANPKWKAAIKPAKEKFFHYALFTHQQANGEGSSGCAEIVGDDFYVSLGAFTHEDGMGPGTCTDGSDNGSDGKCDSTGCPGNPPLLADPDCTSGTVGTVDEHEGTFMHEFGHNLGLSHGGNDDLNWKPNYLSVMNYTFQFSDVVANRPLDYSSWVLPAPSEDGAGPGTCADGSDNGPDGKTDLDDPECLAVPADQFEDGTASCSDGIDNGGDGPGVFNGYVDVDGDTDVDGDDDGVIAGTSITDGYVDVDGDGDIDADDDGTIASEQVIDGGIDMDGDSDVDNDDDGQLGDAADGDCSMTGSGHEDGSASCSDGIDNGGVDGLADTNDPDCSVAMLYEPALDEGDGIDDGLPPAGLAGLNTAFSSFFNESGTGAGSCVDGIDNDGDTTIDANDPGCTQAWGFMGEGPGSCGDHMDNDGDTFVDLQDWDCRCHFKVTSAVGSIDWNMNSVIEGISESAPNNHNIGAVVREPWSDEIPWCATAKPAHILNGHDDWSHLKLIFRKAAAFGGKMPHGPIPFDEPAGGYREDTDGDGRADIADNCLNDANPDQADGDGDGRGNVCDNCPTTYNPSQANSDADSHGNACDNCATTTNEDQLNSDADSHGNACDNCPTTTNEDQLNSDADSHGNACDNCATTTNEDQLNSDADSRGNVCDNCPTTTNEDQLNSDADSHGNACDNCPTTTNEDQLNSDADSQGNACDNCPTTTNEDQTDTDSDTHGNVCDPDDDGDGYTDSDEDAKGSQGLNQASTPEHCDEVDNDLNDGTDEGYDRTRPGGGPPNGVADCVENVDTDGDTLVNPGDADDDGDGVADVDEHYMSTDSLDACPDNTSDDVWPYDTAIDQSIDVGDILMFKPVIMSSEGELNYDRRYDLARDGSIDVGDILMFKPVIMTNCAEFTFTNSTGGAVDDIHIVWAQALSSVFSAADSNGEGWNVTLSPDGLTLDADRPDVRGDLANGGSLSIAVDGSSPATSSCGWTLEGGNKGSCWP